MSASEPSTTTGEASTPVDLTSAEEAMRAVLRASVFDVYERVDTTRRTPKQVAETPRRKFVAHCQALRDD